MEVVVNAGAIRMQCSSQIVTTDLPAPDFYMPDALTVTQPTASKHWRERCSLMYFILWMYFIHFFAVMQNKFISKWRVELTGIFIMLSWNVTEVDM